MSPLVLHSCLAQISGIGMMINCLFSTIFGVWRIRKGAITVDEINRCPFMFRGLRLTLLWIGLIFNVARLIFETVRADVMLIMIVFRIFGGMMQLVEHMYICRHYTRLIVNQAGSYLGCARCLLALACFAGLGVFSALAGINGSGTDAWEHMFWSLAMFVALVGGLIWGMTRPGGLLKNKYITFRNALMTGSIPCILIVLCHLKSKDLLNRVVITLLYLLFTYIFHYLDKREKNDEQNVVIKRRESSMRRVADTGRRWSLRMMGPPVYMSPTGDMTGDRAKGRDRWSLRMMGTPVQMPTVDANDDQVASIDNAHSSDNAHTSDNGSSALTTASTSYPFVPSSVESKLPTTGYSLTAVAKAQPQTATPRTLNSLIHITHNASLDSPSHLDEHGVSCEAQHLSCSSDQTHLKPTGISSSVSFSSLLLGLSSSTKSVLPAGRESVPSNQASQKSQTSQNDPETGLPMVVPSIHRDAGVDQQSLHGKTTDPADMALTDAARKRLLNTILVDKVLIITGQVCSWYVLQFIVELCIIAYYNVNYGAPPLMCPTFVVSGSPEVLAVLQTVFDMMT